MSPHLLFQFLQTAARVGLDECAPVETDTILFHADDVSTIYISTYGVMKSSHYIAAFH